MFCQPSKSVSVWGICLAASLSGLTLSQGKLIQQLADLWRQWLVSDVGMTLPYSASDEPEPSDVEDHRNAMRFSPLVTQGVRH